MNKYFQYDEASKVARLYIKVQTNAKSNSFKEPIVIEDREYLKLQIKAQPVGGKANEVIVAFLSKHYGVPKSDITIKRGASTSLKMVEIVGL